MPTRTIEEVNTELRALWERTFAGRKVYAPMQYRQPKAEALVFVGMNPSFSAHGWKTILRKATMPRVDPHRLFRWPSSDDFDPELAHRLEALAREHYSFFSPHRALAGALNRPWEHFDIFAFRETSQSNVRTLTILKGKDIELTDFGGAQFKIFEDLLRIAKPMAVIVTNALASKIYLKERAAKFDSARGHHTDRLEGHYFPVFCSGMLTGARALDTFSRDRLFWHVAHTLKGEWRPDA